MKYKDLKPNKKVGNYAWNHQANLGSGAFGKVYLGHDTRDDSLVAVKVMNNAQMTDPYLQEALKKEIKTMNMLKSKYVVRLLENFASQTNTYLIQEFCEGGDFRSYLTKKTKLTEQEARQVLNDFLNGFSELVKLGLVHRDLKPENMLIKDGIFKVADFGFAREVRDSKQMLTTCVGTPLYMSPQILTNQPYSSKSDVWSTGVIYYEMLFGKTPWPAKSQYDLVNNIMKMPVKFPYNVQISDISKEFIKGCLQLEEKNRFSWEEVLSHPIYQKGGEPVPNIIKKKNTVVLDQKSIKILTELQEIISKHNVDIEKVFRNFDKSGDKALDINEFTKMILVIDDKLNPEEIKDIFKRFDNNNDGSITFLEFKNIVTENDYRQGSDNELLANYRGDKLLKHLIDIICDNHIDIGKIFTKFDKKKNQVLDFEEFRAILLVLDDTTGEKDAQYIFKKFDKDNSGVVTLEEFRNILEQECKKVMVNNGPSSPRKSEPVAVPKNASPIAKNIIFEIRNIIIQNGLDLAMIFQSFDTSGDGSLNFEEFRRFIEVINARYTSAEVKEVFNAFDINGDGDISFKEFEKMIR